MNMTVYRYTWQSQFPLVGLNFVGPLCPLNQNIYHFAVLITNRGLFVVNKRHQANFKTLTSLFCWICIGGLLFKIKISRQPSEQPKLKFGLLLIKKFKGLTT